MTKQPCVGCDDKESAIYRKGKILMRFIKAGRKVGMIDYVDGQTYWRAPRHAAYPWFEIVDKVKLPVVKDISPSESVYQFTLGEDTMSNTIITEEGILPPTPPPPIRATEEDFQNPDEMMEAEILLPDYPEVDVQLEPRTDLGFPDGKSPARSWNKKQLIAYIRYMGGTADTSVKKDWLLMTAQALEPL